MMWITLSLMTISIRTQTLGEERAVLELIQDFSTRQKISEHGGLEVQ